MMVSAIFCVFWQDFILEHYSEDGTSFQDEIDDLMDLRKVLTNNNVGLPHVKRKSFPP